MTYLQFHLVFILPVIAALALAQRRPMAGIGTGAALKWLGAILVLAFTYTTPWDNYLVYREVWGYPPGRVLATIGYVPVEEYAFFLLQPILTGLFYFLLRGRSLANSPRRDQPPSFRLGLIVGWLGTAAFGVGCLVASGHALYMGLILAWAAPVIAGMAWIGASKLWDERRRVAWSIAIPTVYLWIADRTAIDLGIWDIADATSFGFDPFGLPIEEAMFFAVTNTLVVFGLTMFLPSPSDR
ncbi:MAG: lycopene cyclase domain-containing protein [Bacteroidota bacterium]